MISIEHEVFVVFCTLGQRMPSSSTWQRPADFGTATKNLGWVKSAAFGSITLAKIVRQGRINGDPRDLQVQGLAKESALSTGRRTSQ